MKENVSLFEEAKKSKILFNGLGSTVLFFLMTFVGQFMGGLIILLILSNFVGIDGLDLWLENIHVLLWASMFPIIPCFLWIKYAEKRKISSIGLRREKSFYNFFKGFGIGLLLFTLVALLMYLFGVVTLEQVLNVGIQSISSILIILPGWIVQSSAEEILSRGWLMHVVGARHKPIIGLVVSSVIFAFIHILNPGVNFLSILNIVLVGFLFGLYVIYTKDLFGACGMHAAWNFSQGNLFGFSVSGLEANTNSLLKFSSEGSTVLTGGGFGPEASLFTTIVLSLAIMVIIFKLRKQRQVR